MARRKIYFEKSCPKCGKPSADSSRNALNRVNMGPNGKISRKIRCLICERFLFRQSLTDDSNRTATG